MMSEKNRNEIAGPFIKKIEAKKRFYQDFENFNLRLKAIRKSCGAILPACGVYGVAVSKAISLYQDLTPEQKASLASEQRK